MVDLDSQPIHDGDVDLSDETQDFRFLKHLTKSEQTALPRRGEKDFEPDGTNLQENALEDSRQAMHDALSGYRTHGSKIHVEATWHPSRSSAEVKAVRGPLFKGMGKADRAGTLWLLPEENIYLVERGNLECWWEEGIPMSLQAVYAACLEAAGGLENYQVYAYLKRCGYSVFRSSVNDKACLDNTALGRLSPKPKLRPFQFASFLEVIFGFGDTRYGPLVPHATYKSYDDIYKSLEISNCCHSTARKSSTEFKIQYDVYKPRPNFKKSDPGPPDFIMCVISAREAAVPSLLQINDLFNNLPRSSDLPDKGNVFQKLKEGKRNIVLAVVDSGVISFVRFSDVDFREQKLYTKGPLKHSKHKAGKHIKNDLQPLIGKK